MPGWCDTCYMILHAHAEAAATTSGIVYMLPAYLMYSQKISYVNPEDWHPEQTFWQV